MKGLEWADAVCVFPGWLAAYNKKISEFRKEGKEIDEVLDAEAVHYADGIVADTQPSARGIDLAPMMRDNKNPVAQLLLQFQVPMSVIFQNPDDALVKSIRNYGVLQPPVD